MTKNKFRIISLIADILILAISFLFMAWLRPAGLKAYVPSHGIFFGVLAILWLVVSLINGKMHRGKIINFTTLFNKVISSNVISISITALLMYIFRDYAFSRTVVLGTAIVATILELVIGSVYISYKKANLRDYDEYDKYKKYRKPSEYELVNNINDNGNHRETASEVNPGIISAIENESGPEMAKAIIKMTGSKLSGQTAVLSTTTAFNIVSLPEDKYTYIINLHKINDIRQLDNFIDAVNRKLEPKGYFFCCVETKDQRKKRVLRKFPSVLNYIFYSFDFIVKRILPKLTITRPLYMILTHGNNAVISRAEALGRLCRGGFRIRQESFLGDHLCIEAKKISDPLPSNGYYYGPIIALPRIGKNGETIKVYKLRTMHPYSEYIQDYVYRVHDLQDGGKFKDDFRITSWGSVCRKIWFDELPTFINLLEGNMKLVGVRPLSKQYFELYDTEIRERRTKYKPGLVPPYYADMPADLESIQASELKYLDSYDKHPFLTDVKYFFKSWWNIIFHHARSR
jgi:lipopolysaccharide/colanic/teichoic acid biosynthesis glycosyltransferase